MNDRPWTDLVVRLRAATTDKDNMPRIDSERWLPVGLAREAADEIERLIRALLPPPETGVAS